MAVVYKAYDTRLEREVAVKVIRTERLTLENTPKALKRFEREAKSLGKLTHPNIVPVSDYGEYEGKPYLVMPYLSGGTLKARIGKPMPWQDAVRILISIAKALGYAHEHDIIHRDIKPANILITEKGEPMISDFGVAKLLDSEETMELTGTGAGVGTPEYMAPEQVTSKIFDHRVDVYALGVVFYEMVTGRKPYIADTPMAVMIMHSRDPLPNPKKYSANLPDHVERVLIKALAKDPQHRYQNMGELVTALERTITNAYKPDPEPRKRSQGSPLGLPWWVWWMLFGITGIVLIIGVIKGIDPGRSLQMVQIQTPSSVPTLTHNPSLTSTPTATKISTPTNLPTFTSIPYPTSLPVSLFIPAISQGDKYTATKAGIYRFTVKDGAIQNCPLGADPANPQCGTWTTFLMGFKNREIQWTPNPAGWDFSIGSNQPAATLDQAAEAGIGKYIDITLRANEFVIIVANDCKGCYDDNQGGIQLDIHIVGTIP